MIVRLGDQGCSLDGRFNALHMNSKAGVLTMAMASPLWRSGAQNGIQTQIHSSWSPLFCPFKRVFLRKAHKSRHSARQTWITEALALSTISPVGPGWGPESRPVSFWVFSSVKTTVLPQHGRGEGSQCDRCRLWAGCCTDATDPLEQGYQRLPYVQAAIATGQLFSQMETHLPSPNSLDVN